MFIEQGVTPENKFWKYLIGFALIACAYIVGQIPFTIAIIVKNIANGKGFEISEATAMKLLEPNLNLFLLLLTFVFGIVGVYLVVVHLHKQSFLSVTTSRKKIDWRRFFFSFAIWGVFSIVSTVISYYATPDDFVWNFKPIPFLLLFIIATVMIPIQTSFEEYVFRGYLMQGFANLAFNKWVPLVLTSIIFGIMHIANPEVKQLGYVLLVYYVGTGFLLGILTLMDEGMELSLGFHAANNLIGALLVTSDWSVFQTHSLLRDVSKPSAGWEVVLPVCVVYPLLLLIFSKKYKWSNWKDKLFGKITLENKCILTIEKTENHD